MRLDEAKKLGSTMKKARKKSGLDLCAISKEICVGRGYLLAIEDGDFEALPSYPFAIGFIKSFANEIGLDAVEIAMQFKAIIQPVVLEEEISDNDSPEADIQKLASQGAKPKMKSALYGGVAVMMSALSAVYMVFVGGGQQVALVEKVPDTGPLQLADAQTITPETSVIAKSKGRNDSESLESTSSNVASEVEDFAPASNQLMGVANADEESEFAASLQSAEVMLEARHDVWVRVTSEDAILFEGILSAGDHFVPPMGPELNLTTSNAGALALRIGEHDLGVLGRKGAIIENAKIDPDSLILRLVETL